MKTCFARIVSLALALALVFGLMPAALAADEFADVKTSDWFYGDVMKCAALGIATGYEGRFRPNDTVTGVEFIAMLTRTFYADEVAKTPAPAGEPWYYPNLKAAENLHISDLHLTFANAPISRYDMAQALYNIIYREGKALDKSGPEYQGAQNAIQDMDRVPDHRALAVKMCYALGILTGMDDGTFSGEANMTRAQSCTVIGRMMDLIGAETPAPAEPEKPAEPENPAEPEKTPEDPPAEETQPEAAPAGTLANGQPATVENVSAILEELKEKYPDGYGYYSKFITHGNTDCGFINLTTQWPSNQGGTTSTTAGCGGFAHMVSDTIFGESGAPARQVTDYTKIRPGDIVIAFTDNTHTKITHISIVYKVATNENGILCYSGCHGANPEDGVKWIETPQTYASALSGKYAGVAYTRYPDD